MEKWSHRCLLALRFTVPTLLRFGDHSHALRGVAMQTASRTSFTTVKAEGAILPADMRGRVADGRIQIRAAPSVIRPAKKSDLLWPRLRS